MLLIPKGETVIGHPEANFGNNKSFYAEISKDFYIAETEVSQALYDAVLGGNPSSPVDKDFPVNKVSLGDAIKFVEKISIALGKNFRLPTSIEWEYACQSGNLSKYYWGDNYLKKHIRHSSRMGELEPVRSGIPNKYGLFGMLDNVSEWAAPNGSIKKGGIHYKVRGGNFNDASDYSFMCANFFSRLPFNKTPIIGFRLALDSF